MRAIFMPLTSTLRCNGNKNAEGGRQIDPDQLELLQTTSARWRALHGGGEPMWRREIPELALREITGAGRGSKDV
jgi:hypothetical protein